MTFTGAWGAAFGVAMLLAIGPATPTEQARSMGDGQVGVRRGAFGKTGDAVPLALADELLDLFVQAIDVGATLHGVLGGTVVIPAQLTFANRRGAQVS